MMLYLTTIIILFSFLLCRTATALDGSWSGNMSYAFFPTSSDCSGTPLYFGYETDVKAMEYGNFCVTDNQGGVDMYGKWVIQCVPTMTESTTVETTTSLPSAVYEFFQSCNDVDCQNCSDIPISAVQVPWTNFDKGPPRCMVTRAFNATTTNPVEEFATSSTENFESLLAPPTSESFGKIGESSQEELNEYWQYYFDNSCLGMMDVASSTTTASSSGYYIVRGNYMFQLGILFLSLQAYFMLVEYV